MNFPVFFPVSREFGPETGSLETASTARKLYKLFIINKLLMISWAF
jgi:hypothetical protein